MPRSALHFDRDRTRSARRRLTSVVPLLVAAGMAVAALTCELPVDTTAPRRETKPSLREPPGLVPFNDQPWDVLMLPNNPLVARVLSVLRRVRGIVFRPPEQPNTWRYSRRASSKYDNIVTDATAPFSPPRVLRIVFTPDMGRNHEPSVHLIGLPGVKEIYTAWWIKMSPNWTCSPAGCTKMSFLFTKASGQVYTGLYHPSTDGSVLAPPYRVGVNTEWAPYGQRAWYPNVTTTPIKPGEWHRIEFYYKWETTPGASEDGIIRWWVDGTLNGEYTTVHYPDDKFIEFQFAPTVQNPPPVEQYMYIDHTYISTAATP